MVLAQGFECEALLNVLERRGVLKRTEVLEEGQAPAEGGDEGPGDAAEVVVRDLP